MMKIQLAKQHEQTWHFALYADKTRSTDKKIAKIGVKEMERERERRKKTEK